MPVKLLMIVLLATIFGWIATWVARTFARRNGIVNNPNPIVAQHVKPIAYLGGVGVFLGIVLSLLALLTMEFELSRIVPFSFILPSTLFLALGVWDDLNDLSAAKKFVLQTLVTIIAVAVGNHCSFIGVFVVDFVISAIGILVVVNAFNLVDVCDGLVAGLSIIALVFVACIMPSHSILTAIVAGSCLGFLFWNWPPATIFLGDGGSHLLGFVTAYFGLTLLREQGLWPQLAQCLILIALPLFELCFLVFVRIRKNLQWWKGSPDHFSLRLQAAGLSRLQTDLVAWTVAVIFGVAAFSLGIVPKVAQVALLAGVILSCLLAGRVLLQWEDQSL